MDLEQLNKKIEWLDDERRKDKTTIAMLKERISDLETASTNNSQEIKAIQSETGRLNSIGGKFDQLQTTIGNLKVELSKDIEVLDKSFHDKNKEIGKTRKSEVDSINKSIAEIKKSLDSINEIKRTLLVRQEEEFRITRLVGENEQKVSEILRSDEESKRTIKLLEEGRRQDSKRLTDLLGEVTSIRKRLEEQRGKVDVSTDSTRKLEVRVSELLAAETERRQAVNAFIEKQSLLQVERDRIWKDWQERFGTFDKQTSTIDAKLQTIEAMQRAVKRSQDSFDEITQKFERRINEITEMSRINEDRFRQEWGAYKNDDQKRWTNYTLNQEEQARETLRQLEKYLDRLEKLEDLTQDLQDLLNQVNEETIKRLQAMVNLTHAWTEELTQITKSSD